MGIELIFEWNTACPSRFAKGEMFICFKKAYSAELKKHMYPSKKTT
jgi:hypothetical protein